MKRFLTFALLGGIAALLGFLLYKSSLRLAASRIYHMDECQAVFTARILATNQAGNNPTNVSLFLVPLIWLLGAGNQSVDLFASARLISLLLFWLNLVLIALATGQKLLSGRGLVALIGAVTLAPLWDFGFEVRPENLLLTGLLLTWCAVRVGKTGMPSYLIAGAVAVAMFFTVREALIYVLPLTLAMLFFPRPGSGTPRWRLTLAWAVGALAMFMAIRILYGATGLWQAYVVNPPWSSSAANDAERFERWRVLGRLAGQTPLLLALLAAGLAAVVVDLRRRGRVAFTWDSALPETLLVLVSLAALIVNPAPHNLVIFVPFVYLLAFRYAATILKEAWTLPLGRPLIFTLLLFAHFAPFLIATRRHLNWLNHRQESLMKLAEELTNPATDAIYDGIGIVPTRPSIRSLPGSTSEESRFQVRDLLVARPPSLIIRSYRTDGLPDEDHEFIRGRYVPLADDFWLLGKMLPLGGGTFEIVHAGRYHIAPAQESNVAGTYKYTLDALKNPPPPVSFTATLDGRALTNRTMELSVGNHRIETAPDLRPTVVWAGPNAKQARRFGEGDHRRLFVNWY